MSVLELAESLVAGLWLGTYLFTSFVVSPALKSLPLGEAERVGIRSAIGRRYGRLAGPLLVAWLVVLLLQGFDAFTSLRLALLVLLMLAVGLHGYVYGSRMQALAEQEVIGEDASVGAERAALQRLSARITPVSLVLSLALAVITLFQNAGSM